MAVVTGTYVTNFTFTTAANSNTNSTTINAGNREQENRTMTINSMEQLEGLATDAVITIARPGQETEDWKKRADGKWTNVKARRGGIATRHFRGAVEGGIVTRSSAGRGVAASDEVERRWRIGDRWFDGGQRMLYVVVGAEENTPNNALALSSSDGIRKHQTSTSALVNAGYRRVGAPGVTMPSAGNWAGLLNEAVDILFASVPKQVPESLADELRAHLLTHPDAELLGMFSKHNVDLSVETDVKAAGTSVVEGDDLAMLLGTASKLSGTQIETPWETEFKTRVVPGCICDSTWEEAVVDREGFDLAIPEKYDNLEVSVKCPVHPDGPVEK